MDLAAAGVSGRPLDGSMSQAAAVRRVNRVAGGHPASVADTIITPYRDGPLLVRGPFRIVDQDGDEIVNDREVVALCRCGKSRLRPFCDGTHKLVRFKAPSGAERGREPELA
jgi:CDGSH-type Zn-finger protein